MKKIGVVGSTGKLGSLLLGLPNFVSVDCDVTHPASIDYAISRNPELDVLVNCAAISNIEECANDYDKAIQVNSRGLHNLHKVFGSRVLQISTDQVFSGKSWWLPSESTKLSPINSYGWSKVGAESVSNVNDGKVIRLSRTVSISDRDIHDYLWELASVEYIDVPTFFHRNYIHRKFAVEGIAYFAQNFDAMPQIVNYGGSENFSMYQFMFTLAEALGGYSRLVRPNDNYVVNKSLSPRPKRGGFKVDLAKKLGFPMYDVADTVAELVREYNA